MGEEFGWEQTEIYVEELGWAVWRLRLITCTGRVGCQLAFEGNTAARLSRQFATVHRSEMKMTTVEN